MTIGYAIMANDECYNFVRKIQLELHQEMGTGLARQSPHVTIKSPFETDEIEDHVLYLESLSNSIKSFELELEGFGSFGENVIFLAVKKSQKLMELHQKILSEVKAHFGLEPHDFEGENIRFHMSVAGFDSSESFHSAQLYLKKYNPKFKYKIETLGLFYYLGNGNGWIVNRKISIGSQGKSDD